MATRMVGWGIFSTARINQALIGPLQLSRRNQLVAVASRNLDRAKAYAAKWDIPLAYGSYEELLDNPDIDVIYNPLPNSLHKEWTVKAAQAGKHVLCEKPLAISVGEVDEIINAAEKNNVFVAEALMYRHHEQTLTVKEMVERGDIGQLQLINGSFSFTLDRPGDIRLDPKLGGGSIWDVGSYPISYARYVSGMEPVEVFGYQELNNAGVDLSFFGVMRFPDGVYAKIDSSFQMPLRAQIEIVGSDGTIFIPTPYKPAFNEKVILQRGDKQEPVHIPGGDLYLGEVEDLAEAILSGKPPRISLLDSRGNVAAIQGLLRSARENIPVRLTS